MKSLKTFFIKILIVISFSFIGFSSAFAGDVINVDVGLHNAELISLPKNMTHVIIADRSVAGVVKHGSRKASVIGNGIGKTDIRFMNGKRIVRQVNLSVHQDLTAIKRSLKELFPNEQMGIKSVNGSVAMTGVASNAETAAQAVKIVEEYMASDEKVLNLMRLRSGQQVMLRVRVGELRRDELKKLGLGLHGIISSGSAVFGALERDGAFKVLAEPTLTAISGETAQFLAGGEFPIPIAQAGDVMSVDYKSYGIGVNFTPIVMSENRIRLDVESEVSELDDSSAVSVRSIRLPSISTRRVNTTVELAPGESFMIAGLIKANNKANIHKVPGLGDIPLLSPIFRSASFQRNETELVIAVTPYLADPVASETIRMPGEDFQYSSMLEMLFFGNLEEKESKNSSRNTEKGLEGSIGYLVD